MNSKDRKKIESMEPEEKTKKAQRFLLMKVE